MRQAGHSSRIEHIVVIYAENRSFDNLYGLFPAPTASPTRRRRSTRRSISDGKPLPHLPPVWKGKDADPAFPQDLPNRPFRIDAPPINLPLSATTRDLIHKFYPQPGADQRRAQRPLRCRVRRRRARRWATTTARRCRCGKWAQELRARRQFLHGRVRRFVPQPLLADLRVHAATTERAAEPARAARRARLAQDDARLAAVGADRAAASSRRRVHAGRLFGQHRRSRRTSRRACRRRKVAIRALPIRRSASLPPQTLKTIGDTLSREGRVVGVVRRRLERSRSRTACSRPTRQAHGHRQPRATARRTSSRITSRSTISRASRRARATASAHLKDYTDLVAGIDKGELPQVAFYKPQGTLNEHPGYADMLSGDQHIAELVAKIKASPLWASTAIIVTYDENGGFWDHVAPPEGRSLGSGHAHSGDHHFAVSQSAATSTTRPTIRRRSSSSSRVRFGLEPLPGVRAGRRRPDGGIRIALRCASRDANRGIDAYAPDAASPRFRAACGCLGSSACAWTLSSELVHSLLPLYMAIGAGRQRLRRSASIEGVAEATGADRQALLRRHLRLVSQAQAAGAARLRPRGRLEVRLSAGADTVAGSSRALRRSRRQGHSRRAARCADRRHHAGRARAARSFGLRQALDTGRRGRRTVAGAGRDGVFRGQLPRGVLDRGRPGDAVPCCSSSSASTNRTARRPPTHERTRLRLADVRRLPRSYRGSSSRSPAVLTLARFSEAFLVLRAQNVGLRRALGAAG